MVARIVLLIKLISERLWVSCFFEPTCCTFLLACLAKVLFLHSQRQNEIDCCTRHCCWPAGTQRYAEIDSQFSFGLRNPLCTVYEQSDVIRQLRLTCFLHNQLPVLSQFYLSHIPRLVLFGKYI